MKPLTNSGLNGHFQIFWKYNHSLTLTNHSWETRDRASCPLLSPTCFITEQQHKVAASALGPPEKQLYSQRLWSFRNIPANSVLNHTKRAESNLPQWTWESCASTRCTGNSSYHHCSKVGFLFKVKWIHHIHSPPYSSPPELEESVNLPLFRGSV